MPTSSEFWEVAAQVASERGGLVVGFVREGALPELGSTLDNVLGFNPPGPATVSSFSDWKDWDQQAEAFYRLRPSWGRGKPADPTATYYRVSLPAPELTTKSRSPIDAAPSYSGRLAIPSFSGYAAPVGKLKGVTFWPRALARIIDFVVHYLTAFAAGILFVFILTIASGGRPPLWVLARISQMHLPTFIASLLGSFAYFVICQSIHGSTLGKFLLSLQVIQEDGSRCRPGSAIIRELGYFVDVLFFGLIAYFAMHYSDEQQRFGDQWAHTIVCKRADVPPGSRQTAMRFVLGFMLGIFVDIGFLMAGLLIQMNS